MKLSHAAALALLGWYLILPPLVQGPVTDRRCQQGVGPNEAASMSHWVIKTGFDTAKECERQKDKIMSEAQALDLTKLSMEDFCAQAAIALQVQEAQCVATDDPRLKEN